MKRIIIMLVALYVLTISATLSIAHEDESWEHVEGTITNITGVANCGFGIQLWRIGELWYPVFFAHGQLHMGIPQETEECP